jgi:hypothetical protein
VQGTVHNRNVRTDQTAAKPKFLEEHRVGVGLLSNQSLFQGCSNGAIPNADFHLSFLVIMLELLPFLSELTTGDFSQSGAQSLQSSSVIVLDPHQSFEKKNEELRLRTCLGGFHGPSIRCKG